jgi:hypothetical protein
MNMRMMIINLVINIRLIMVVMMDGRMKSLVMMNTKMIMVVMMEFRKIMLVMMTNIWMIRFVTMIMMMRIIHTMLHEISQ